jgi:hypothetical protein
MLERLRKGFKVNQIDGGVANESYWAIPEPNCSGQISASTRAATLKFGTLPHPDRSESANGI